MAEDTWTEDVEAAPGSATPLRDFAVVFALCGVAGFVAVKAYMTLAAFAMETYQELGGALPRVTQWAIRLNELLVWYAIPAILLGSVTAALAWVLWAKAPLQRRIATRVMLLSALVIAVALCGGLMLPMFQ